MSRGGTNGLAERPEAIYRAFTPAQRTANGRKGGINAGRLRAQQARAKVRRIAADALHENGYDKAVMPVMLDAFELVYAAGYRNGYQAVWARDRRRQKAADKVA